MADFISKWTSGEIDAHLGKGLKAATIAHTTSGIEIGLVSIDDSTIIVKLPNANGSSIVGTAKSGLIRGTELKTLNNLSALEEYIDKLVELAENGGGDVDLTVALNSISDKVSTLEDKAMRTIIEVAGVDYTTTTAPTNSIATNGLPLYWLARPAVFAVKSGTTYYTMPSTDERFAVCGLRRTGQLFKCGGETFYLDENLNPVFVNSSVRFDRSGTSVKVYPSNSTLRSLYEAAGAVWNENTGYYELNGVNDIDEEEMQKIYSNYSPSIVGNRQYGKHSNRTLSERVLFSVYTISSMSTAFNGNANIVAIPFAGIDNIMANASYAYSSCSKLRKTTVKHYGLTTSNTNQMATNCHELVYITIYYNKGNLSFSDSSRISYYSLDYLATNASGTAFTLTLPTAQAQVLNAIIGRGAVAVTDLTVDDLNSISGILAQMPWEAKLKSNYSQPIWREDNGSTIAFTNRFFVLDEAGNEYTFRDASFNDARPSLIKHETGANGEYIYASWKEYVADKLAKDQTNAGSELAQYTTAENTTFATSIYDWIILANKFVAKGITIADGGATATSEEE